jgi:hypothetical protein
MTTLPDFLSHPSIQSKISSIFLVSSSSDSSNNNIINNSNYYGEEETFSEESFTSGGGGDGTFSQEEIHAISSTQEAKEEFLDLYSSNLLNDPSMSPMVSSSSISTATSTTAINLTRSHHHLSPHHHKESADELKRLTEIIMNNTARILGLDEDIFRLWGMGDNYTDGTTTTMTMMTMTESGVGDGNNGSAIIGTSTNNIFTFDENSLPREFRVMSESSKNSVIAYIILFVIALVGNLTVFVSVFREYRKQRGRIPLLILHLAVADLMVCLCLIPIEVVWRITIQWYGGNVMCKLCQFLRAFGLYLSSMVVICVSVDRFFAILYPFKTIEGRQRVKIMLWMAWIAAGVFAVPQVGG